MGMLHKTMQFDSLIFRLHQALELKGSMTKMGDQSEYLGSRFIHA